MMLDKRDECGCHRDCSWNDAHREQCENPCSWPSCLTDAEHQELAEELSDI